MNRLFNCPCEDAGQEGVRYCDTHHAYHRGGKRLVSVTQVIKTVRPVDYSGVDPAVLEHARHRGIAVDALFCAWLEGRPLELPAGIATAEDDPLLRPQIVEVFSNLQTWWNLMDHPGHVETQVIFADDEIAGTCDLIEYRPDGIVIYDLKCVSSLQDSYRLQLAAYRQLACPQVTHLGLIHCKPKAKPRMVPVDVAKATEEWLQVRAEWKAREI